MLVFPCCIHKSQISHKFHSLFSWPIPQFHRIPYRLFEYYKVDSLGPSELLVDLSFNESDPLKNAGIVMIKSRQAWSKKFLGVRMVLGSFDSPSLGLYQCLSIQQFFQYWPFFVASLSEMSEYCRLMKLLKKLVHPEKERNPI